MPKLFNQRKLEARRSSVTESIASERSEFNNMVQRARLANENIDSEFVKDVEERMNMIARRAEQETELEKLDMLEEEAQKQGRLRAYLCPIKEAHHEGTLMIDLMAEWYVPDAVIRRLRELLESSLRNGTDAKVVRGALRAIYHEYDTWEEYIEGYEEAMFRTTAKLVGATAVCLALGMGCLLFGPWVLSGIVFAGAAGSCVSVLAKMPALAVALSGEFGSYGRRALARIAIGTIASVAGCAVLAWGLLNFSVQNLTFAQIINTCTATGSAGMCTGSMKFVLLGIPMLFGFSERALGSLEERVFGGPRKRDDRHSRRAASRR